MKKTLSVLLVLFVLAGIFTVLPASAADPVFSDVNKSMWRYESIRNAVKSG